MSEELRCVTFLVGYLVAGGASSALVHAMFRDSVEFDLVTYFIVIAFWPMILPATFGFWTMGLVLKRRARPNRKWCADCEGRGRFVADTLPSGKIIHRSCITCGGRE